MDYFDYKTHVRPATGRLLLSEPSLPDENFERSVILLCAHDAEGSFGFVMNKPSETLVGSVLEGFPDSDQVAFVGGPVGLDTLHLMHSFSSVAGAQQIIPGVFWGGDPDEIKELAVLGRCRSERIRFMLGYSGWGPGQLDEEMRSNSWIVSDRFDARLLFEVNPDAMWATALRNLGGKFMRYVNYPADPRLN